MFYSKGLYITNGKPNEVVLKSITPNPPKKFDGKLPEPLIFIDYTDKIVYIKNDSEIMLEGLLLTKYQ